MRMEVKALQKRITELENIPKRTSSETKELKKLIIEYPDDTDLFVNDETLEQIFPLQ